MTLEEKRKLAEDPNTPQEKLTELFKTADTTIQACVIANASVPPTIAIAGAALYPLAFLLNPCLFLWSLEDTGFWNAIPDGTMRAMAQLVITDSRLAAQRSVLLGLFARYGGRSTIEELSRIDEFYTYLLPDIVQRHDANHVLKGPVLVSIARNANTPAELLIAISKQDNSTLSGYAVANPNMPYDRLLEIARNGSQWLRGHVLNHPKCDDRLRKMIGTNG